MSGAPEILILAGGAGVRLWPASRAGRPKQFLKIPHGTALVAQAVERARAMAPDDRIWIVTLASHVEETRKALPGFRTDRILAEPVGRNSGPAACFGTLCVEALRGESVTVLVMPADHFIPDLKSYRKAMLMGLDRAGAGESLVTFGLPVKEPRTDFGYVHAEGLPKKGVRAVRRFVEKPPIDQARKFAKSKDYFWNSGTFAWRSDRFRAEMADHAPDIFGPISSVNFRDPSWPERLPFVYEKVPGVSVDYALMERSSSVEVVPSKFPWSDLGTWSAVHEAVAKGTGNVILGEGEIVGGKGNLVHAETKPVVLFGVDDLVVVESPSAVMVTTRARSRELKEFQKKLKRVRP